ncbi:Uu.00g136470.m01.CDS01 [Anthostomella pinea]|uniref:Uu.00g136470.m01.CDS01 n=1 Tax=Anthostomella pinea TaxID=933095 RepID=A0AAI8VQI5_9PEZI|nr:Uu.00g136470.m01.CDS01 [Anthostomella pinea]
MPSQLDEEMAKFKEYEATTRAEQNQQLRDRAKRQTIDSTQFFEGATKALERFNSYGLVLNDAVQRALVTARETRQLSSKGKLRATWVPADIEAAKKLLNEAQKAPGESSPDPVLPCITAAPDPDDSSRVLSPQRIKSGDRTEPALTGKRPSLEPPWTEPGAKRMRVDGLGSGESMPPQPRALRDSCQPVESIENSAYPEEAVVVHDDVTPTKLLFEMSEASLKRLQPGGWLDDCAVYAAFQIIKYAASIDVVDSLKTTTKLPWSSSEQVFAPIHTDGNHWVLAVIKKTRKDVVVYDSLPSLSSREKIEAQIRRHLQLNPRTGYSFMFTGPLLQTNSADCGLYAIAVAFYLSVGVRFPEAIDGSSWRGMLSTLLGPLSDSARPAPGDSESPRQSSFTKAKSITDLSTQLAEAFRNQKERIKILDRDSTVLEILQRLHERHFDNDEVASRLSSAIDFCKMREAKQHKLMHELKEVVSQAREMIEV